MMNSPFVTQEALAIAARIEREAGTEPAARFIRAWRLAFGRAPSAAEIEGGLAFLARQTEAASANPAPADPKTPPPDPARVALANLCQALVSSNGFLYVD